MSRKIDTETARALNQLVAGYFELLATHYHLAPSSGAPWQMLTQHVCDLHQWIIRQTQEETSDTYAYTEVIKALVVSHWTLWQTYRGEEPPACLVDVIDYVERNYLTWFGYERGRWVEE